MKNGSHLTNVFQKGFSRLCWTHKTPRAFANERSMEAKDPEQMKALRLMAEHRRLHPCGCIIMSDCCLFLFCVYLYYYL